MIYNEVPWHLRLPVLSTLQDSRSRGVIIGETRLLTAAIQQGALFAKISLCVATPEMLANRCRIAKTSIQ